MKNDYLSIRVANRDYATDCIHVYTHWTYLHGYIEEDLGYDIFEVTDTNSIAVDTEIIANTKVFGINFEGKIEVRCENVDKPCIGYFWKSKFGANIEQRGLVCYADDADANAYAERCMNDKVERL